jgi:hypothetical protein
VPTYPYYLANKPLAPNDDLEVTDKYSGEIVAHVAVADARAIDTAIATAEAAQAPLRKLPAHHRRRALETLELYGIARSGLGFEGPRLVLELGGNAACVVDLSADIPDAVDRTIFGAFYQSGQSCISVQRILVHEQIYATFRDRLVEATRGLKMGDPKAEETFIGPMISEAETRRLEGWIRAALRVPVDIVKELAQRPVNAQTGHVAEYSTKEAISPADKQDRSAELSTSRTQPDKSARPSPVGPNGGAFDGLRPGMPPKPPRLFTPSLPHEYARLTPESRARRSGTGRRGRHRSKQAGPAGIHLR